MTNEELSAQIEELKARLISMEEKIEALRYALIDELRPRIFRIFRKIFFG